MPMPASAPVPKSKKPQGDAPSATKRKNRGAWLARPILFVLGISLAIHVLFLLAFGSVAVFKGKIPQMPFVSQQIAGESAEEVSGPPDQEPSPVEDKITEPTSPEIPVETPNSPSPVEHDLLVANLPSLSHSFSQVSTAVTAGSLKEAVATTASSAKSLQLSSSDAQASVQLFGIPVRAKKLGVIVDISKSMQRYSPGIFREIFDKFPDADVVLTNGGGMQDWETALKAFNDEVVARKKSAKERGVDFRGATKMDRPKLARFNTSEAEDWVPVRGSKIDREEYRGLKANYPELYEQIRKRGNTWFITSYSAANAVYLAFEELIRRKAEAIYWFSDFADPIEGKEAEVVTRLIRENQIEVILHSTKGKGKAAEWATQVDAKFVKARF